MAARNSQAPAQEGKPEGWERPRWGELPMRPISGPSRSPLPRLAALMLRAKLLISSSSIASCACIAMPIRSMQAASAQQLPA